MKSCCPTIMKPIASGYARKGFNVYIAGTPAAETKKGIVLIPDIFGNHPNAYQFADVLSSHGFLVAMPDLFPDNSAWPTDNWPPNFQGAEWQAFYGRVTNFEHFVGEVKKSADLLRNLGCTSVGTVGLCWGAKVALAALKQKVICAAACPHPSFLDISDVTNANGPIAFLMSKDEAAFDDVKEELSKNAFADKNVFVRYDDLYHGFLGARGPLEKAFDFETNDQVAARVAEASDVVVKFFQKAL